MADTLSPQGQWRWDEKIQDWIPNATATQPTTTTPTGMSQENWQRAALMDLLTTGGKNLSKIKAAQELISPQPPAAEAEVERKEAGAKEVIDQLFEIYYGKEGEKSLALTEPGKYRLPAQLKALGTKVKAGKANSIEQRIYEYNRILESKRAKLAKAAGDAGNLALQEQILAGKGLPGVDATPGEAVTLFNSAYDAFAGGRKPERLEKEPEKLRAVATVSQKELPKSQFLEKTLPTAGLVAATGLSLLPPVGPLAPLKGLGLVGRLALAGAITGATQPAENIGQRLQSAGGQALLGGGLGTILRPLQTARVLGGVARSKAVTAKIPVAPAVKAAREYLKDVPLAKGISKKFLPGLQKTKEITISQAEKKLDRWGPLTYTKAGDPKSTAEAGLMNILYGGIRQQIAEKAPLVSAARTASSKIQKGQRYLGRMISPITIGAGAAGAGGAYLLNRILGRE